MKHLGYPSGTYTWRRNVPVKAQVVGAVLEDLHKHHGGLSPAIVVDAARPAESALHPLFTWDDTLAAELHRQNEARYILRNLGIVYTRKEGEETEKEPRVISVVRVQAFPSVVQEPTENEDEGEDGVELPQRRYISIYGVLANPQTRAYYLHQARGELASWRRKYSDLREFADLFAKIDETLRELPDTIDAPMLIAA